MTTINITEFKGYDQQAFLDFLQIHSKSFIELIVPKDSDESEVYLILNDYYRAFYIGQLLLPCTFEIMHNAPNPYKKGEFSFILISDQFEELSQVLTTILAAYDYDSEEDAYIQFDTDAVNLPLTLGENDVIACPYFYDMIIELSEDEDL